MVPNAPTLVVATGLLLALLGFAFIAAPHSCEWGLKAYAGVGFGVLLVLFLLPWLLEPGATPGRRVLFGLGLSTLGAAIWTGGLFIADFRLLCRLF